jgi:outer membrane protein insertion porin family
MNYRRFVDEVGNSYFQLGLRDSGVDLERTTLENGLLTIRFRELRIAAFDTMALGIDPSELSLKIGDLFNYDQLLDDVRRLAAPQAGDVRIETLVTATGAVRVRFALGAPETAGPISSIQLEGNTRISDAELLNLLSLGVGDPFSSALAQEDFRRIRSAYEAIGVVIDTRPSFNYLDGVYVQRITELVIAEYRLVYDGEPGRTQERVVTRYLPAVGEPADLLAIDQGLRQLARLGIVTPVNRILAPGAAPDEVVVEVVLRANATGLLQPGASFSTDTGLAGSVTYAESNFLGLAHNVSVDLSIINSDVGLQFGASARYAVPWLDIDVLDFRTVPTSFSVALFSQVDINQPLSADGRFNVTFPGLDPNAEGTSVAAGEYLVRSTGLSVSFGRRVLPFTDLSVSARATTDAYTLEPGERCVVVDGVVTNADRCALEAADAIAFLPQGGLSAFASAGLGFDNRDNDFFPSSGLAANVNLGFGWGNDMIDAESGDRMAYSYVQTQFGVRSYFALADLIPEMTARNQVLAVRFNAGAQFGETYPASRRFRVGGSQTMATEIRGYRDSDLDPSRSYLTSSLEYRFDFGFDTFATETIIAILFVDLGYIPSLADSLEGGRGFAASVGGGVQVNLGFGGVALPALRFDYGFSERNPGGVFSFRVGQVF